MRRGVALRKLEQTYVHWYSYTTSWLYLALFPSPDLVTSTTAKCHHLWNLSCLTWAAYICKKFGIMEGNISLADLQKKKKSLAVAVLPLQQQQPRDIYSPIDSSTISLQPF
jgi:hypothetical protein